MASRLFCLACEGFSSAWSSAKLSDQFLHLVDVVVSTPTVHPPQAPGAHIPATHVHKQLHISYLYKHTPACMHTCLHILIIVLIRLCMYTQLYENKHRLALHILSTHNCVHIAVSMPTCIHSYMLLHSCTYTQHPCLEPSLETKISCSFFCMTLPVLAISGA